jgi:ribosomal protein S15P/S13E
MNEIEVSKATLVTGLILANAAGLIGAYVSIRVQIAILNEKVKYLTEWMKTHNKKSPEEE